MSAVLLHVQILDEICFDAVDLFLKKHEFAVLDDRLLSNVKGELDAVVVLREICFKQMSGSPERLIEVYEKAYDRKQSPHYENLIDTTLLNFLLEVLAAILGGIIVEEYSRNRDKILGILKKHYRLSRKRINARVRKVLEKYDHSLKYLFRVYALREYAEKEKAPFANFIEERENIRRAIYLDEDLLPNDFHRFEEDFMKEHSLPNLKESYSGKLEDELLSLLIEHEKTALSEEKAGHRQTSKPTSIPFFSTTALQKRLEGIPTNKGVAVGKVSILRTPDDCDKVERGDIVVLIQHNPDFIPASRLAGALVGDKGGLTSHTAIVGRALGLPTIVGTESGTSVLKDGMYVFVDAFAGCVYEIQLVNKPT